MPRAKHAMRLKSSPTGLQIVRPGARYAYHRDDDVFPGAWVPEADPLPPDWIDVFTETEGRLLLPFLRARGTGGRRALAPTSPDGKLIARACKALGLTAAGLAEKIGTHESVLSRARQGQLPAAHRDAIRALFKEA